MSKVSTNPPSGFRDFLPAEAAARLELVDTISRIYRAHGFQTIGLPFLENLSTLQGKGGGSDNEKLIFKVMQRGESLQRALGSFLKAHRDELDRQEAAVLKVADSSQGNVDYAKVSEAMDQFTASSVTFTADGYKNFLGELQRQGLFDELADMGLRFDLTLPLARYCARFREQLPKPFKVFQIGPVWRADRPQKGRFREFFQCDVDIIGSKEIGAEVDCISAILEVFEAAGMKGVEVHLNDRRLLAALGRSLGIADAAWSKCLVSLDKLDKMPPEKVFEEIKGTLGEGSGAAVDALTKLFTADGDQSAWAALDAEAHASVLQVKTLLEAAAGEVPVKFNPTMIRGQDYYTGTIFEIRHPDLSGSLGGGGRYNRLMEVFGAPETPAFGGSIGFERLTLLLQEQNRLVAREAGPQMFFPLFSEELRAPVLALSNLLRRAGLRVDVYPDAGTKFGKQLGYASDRKIPFAAILGPTEAAASLIKIKNMNAGTEQTYSTESPEKFAEEVRKLCNQ